MIKQSKPSFALFLFIFLFCFAFVGQEIKGFSGNQNYVLSITPLDATDSIRISGSNVVTSGNARVLSSVQYLDGIGRPVQRVEHRVTPDRKDLVYLQEYDVFGRESKSYLPFPYAGDGAYQTSLNASRISTAYDGDSYPYSQTIYETSPLNRIKEQYAPGESWREDSGHSVKLNYLTNDSEHPCFHYTLTDSGFKNEGTYYAAMLHVTETQDEDGNLSYEFKNAFGELLLSRQVNNGINHDTYYIYDDFGRQVYVIPPALVDLTPPGSYSETHTAVKNYAYIYTYDEKHRCISKKIPGAEAIHYVYDRCDRQVLVQDGEQRLKSPQQWTFTKYDIFGRVIMTGICDFGSMATSTLRTIINTCAIRETFDGTRPFTYYYTNNSYFNFSNYIRKVETVNYYDNYQYSSLSFFLPDELYHDAPPGYEDKVYLNAKGLLTGSLTALDDDDSTTPAFLTSVFYYDNKGRIIQSHSSNHLNGYDNEYTNYSFAGQPTWNRKQHTSKYLTEPIDEIYTYTYDHADRLKETRYKLNNDPEIVLSEIMYDDLGRIKKKEINNKKRPIQYTYNIRNWTKSIDSEPFSQTLYYENSFADNTPCYNGNISAMTWKSSAEEIINAYCFTYDNLNRLTHSHYGRLRGENTINYTQEYDEHMEYDKMGNPTHITRLANRYRHPVTSFSGLVDDIELTYSGNQRESIMDAGHYNLAGFVSSEYSLSGDQYRYNANGALIVDNPKGISCIDYNYLNLPQKIQFIYGHSTAYLYDAIGTKRRVIHTTVRNNLNVPLGSVIAPSPSDVVNTLTTDYCGRVIYENGYLKRVLTDEGYATPAASGGGSSVLHYFISDHRGNIRTVVGWHSADAYTIAQRNDYYPFGLPYKEGSGKGEQPYKFEGKELDEMHRLNLYDQGARFFGCEIPVTTTPDPLADKYPSMSPYCQWANNPVRYVDPDGKIIESIWDIGSLVLGAKSFVDNVKAGDVGAAAVDGLGVVFDAVAVAIPGIPGGVGAAIKGVRAVDAAISTKKAATMTENAAKGKAFEKQVGESLGNNKASQVTIEAADGTKTKVDFVQKQDGKVTLTEAKSSQTAPLTPNQKKAHPQIEQSGGTVKGNKGAIIGLPNGEKIPPTKVEIIRPEYLMK